MRGGLRIGSVFGIDIVVDLSWLFIFVLMIWNLTVVFVGWHPTWSHGACGILAFLATFLFYGSVLAHELAHAFVAMSYGTKVRQIRLFLFGGVSDIEREPPSPRAELLMALAGPLTSIVLGLLFFVIAAWLLGDVDAADPLGTLSRLSPLGTLFFWLGPVNLALGTFNLMPGFPLDGGRVLRAIVWKLTGDLDRATLIASTLGRMIGWTFTLAGIAMIFGAHVPYLGSGSGAGLWFAFIGWFLSSSAQSGYAALQIREMLAGVRVAHLMRRSGLVIPADTNVRSVATDWFLRSSERAYPVVTDGALVGIVAVGDVRKVAQDAWDRTPVTAIMTPRLRVTTTTAEEDAEVALRKLGEADVNQLPVLDGERLVGMLTRADIARWLEVRAGMLRLRAA